MSKTNQQRADEEDLAGLHGSLTTAIQTAIRTDPTPALLNVARQFLRDNGITCDGPRSPKLTSLADSLADITLEDMQQ